MRSLIRKTASIFMFTGVISVLFGILVLAWPGKTLVTLVWLFAIPFIIQGLLLIIGGIRHRHEEPQWWLLLLLGLVSIAAGVVAIMYPAITTFLFMLLIGSTWLMNGILLIATSYQLRHQMKNEGWLILSGILSVIAGLYVLFNPGEGALSMVWLIGIFAVLFGLILIIFGYRAKSWNESRLRRVAE